MHKVLGTLTDEEQVQFKRLATEQAALDGTLDAAMRSHTESNLRLKRCSEELWDGIRARIPDARIEAKISINHTTGEIIAG
jgi:hypothetical protein